MDPRRGKQVASASPTDRVSETSSDEDVEMRTMPAYPIPAAQPQFPFPPGAGQFPIPHMQTQFPFSAGAAQFPIPPAQPHFPAGYGFGQYVGPEHPGTPFHGMAPYPPPGSGLDQSIYRAGIYARPGYEPPLEYPSGAPHTLRTQFQPPSVRGAGSSGQGGQPRYSPSSVHGPGGSTSSQTGTEGTEGSVEDQTRGLTAYKTHETGNRRLRVRIRLNGKHFIVESEHDKVKGHSDVISDIGAVVSNNFPGRWWKLPGDKQVVKEKDGEDEGYVWPKQIQYWLDSLRRRYAWPREQKEDVIQRFHKAFAKKLSQMMYDARCRHPDKAHEHPDWATPQQWKEMLERIAQDRAYLRTCELNKRNRNASGKTSTHATGRKSHLKAIADAEKKKGGKLCFAEQLMLTHGKKGATYDPSAPADQAEVVDHLKPRLKQYYADAVEAFGGEEEQWPEDWNKKVAAHLKNPVYKGNVPGFAYMSPADVTRSRRRTRNPPMDVGQSDDPEVTRLSAHVEALEAQNERMLSMMAKFFGGAPDAPGAAAARADLAAELEEERLRRVRREVRQSSRQLAASRWQEERRREELGPGVAAGSSAWAAGDIGVEDYRPDLASAHPYPNIFAPGVVVGAPEWAHTPREAEDIRTLQQHVPHQQDDGDEFADVDEEEEEDDDE